MSACCNVLLTGLLVLQLTCARKCPYGQRFVDGSCYKHCSKVCRNVKLSCEPFLEAPSSPHNNVSSWVEAENVPCFQRERDQITGEMFLRTSCKCPDRIYTNTSNPAAFFNCILSEITEKELEINFGQLCWVQIGAIRALERDIDFQGNTKRNLICVVDTAEDVEFGSLTKFSYNVVNTTIVGDDLQFEQGSIVGPYNVFSTVNISDKFRFVDDNLEQGVRVIRNNWGKLTTGECEIETEIQPSIIGNICSEATIVKDVASCFIKPIVGGLSCLQE